MGDLILMENLTYRYIEDSDFELLQSWYIEREGVKPMRDLFPEIGYLLSDIATNEPYFACWLYKTDSSICIIDSLIAAPGLAKTARREAIKQGIELLVKEAKLLGFSIIWVTPERESLNQAFETCGFSRTGQEITAMIQYIGKTGGC